MPLEEGLIDVTVYLSPIETPAGPDAPSS
jgi:hypothetical protein